MHALDRDFRFKRHCRAYHYPYPKNHRNRREATPHFQLSPFHFNFCGEVSNVTVGPVAMCDSGPVARRTVGCKGRSWFLRIEPAKPAPYGATVPICHSPLVLRDLTPSLQAKHSGTKHAGASEAKLLPRIYRAKPAPYGAGIFLAAAQPAQENRPRVLRPRCAYFLFLISDF